LSATETFGAVAGAFLATHRFDLVHALSATSAIAARMSGHRVVFTTLGHPTVEDFGYRGHGSRQLFTLAARLSSVATGLSRSAAAQVEAISGRPAVVLSPGVRTDSFQPDLSPRAGPVRILFPSDASERRKGLDVLVAAVGRLLDRHPDTRLQLAGPGEHGWVLAGDGPFRLPPPDPAATAAIDVLGVGELGDMPARYRGATVTVLVSAAEAFGLVLVESLACGTPVVGGDAGGSTDILEGHPEVGEAVRYGDVDGLVSGLDSAIALARRPDTPARCVAHAARWDWRAGPGPAHEDLYRSVVRRPRR
ncbi:MAG TPA: glycosyltransferase, partial [Acidimicrobiales bacterium]|nr:glycosyltransferase [Acidimicrobiales bacterium]